MATEVWTAADLNNVQNDLSGSYTQMADIDMAGVYFPAVGYMYGSWFTGSYDGGGYTISNLTASSPIDPVYGPIPDGVAMFGAIGAGVVLQNIKLSNVTATGTAYIGGLVGYSAGGNRIYNCAVVDSTVSGDYDVGMLVGGMDSAILGGTFTIEKCAVKGSAAGTSGGFDTVGGLVGDAQALTVINCYSRVNISGSGYLGGLLGWAYNATVTNCYATGSVPAGAYSGGLIGGITGLTITNSYYDSETSGRSDTTKGTPRTTLEMTYPENFTTTFIGWDWASVWKSDPSFLLNDGYPVFEGFGIWVKKSPNPSFLPPLWLDWKIVPVLWVYKAFEWKPVTGVWVKKGDEWKLV